MAPDWAAALAPVDERIAAMGRFLRDEIAAGRTYLPSGDHVLRAFQRPLADVRVLIVGQDPTPRRATRSGSASRWMRTSGRRPAAWPTSTRSCTPTWDSRRRRTAT